MNNKMEANFVPLPYRRVAIKDVGFALTDENIRMAVGKKVYGKTDFIVLRSDGDTGVVQVGKNAKDSLFQVMSSVAFACPPQETAFLLAPDCDVGSPSDLAREWHALGNRRQVRCLVVEGRFGHVNFILNPDPLHITVVDHARPLPRKLPTLLREILADENLPPIIINEQPVDPVKGVRASTAPTVLFPCRSGGFDCSGEVGYLDQHPAKQADWVLVGCERSASVYAELYGESPQWVDICPLGHLPAKPGSDSQLLVTRCCKLESGFQLTGDSLLQVAWGVTKRDLRDGLAALLKAAAGRKAG